jgi:MFS transporter, MHS family, proline/betaine transporter
MNHGRLIADGNWIDAPLGFDRRQTSARRRCCNDRQYTRMVVYGMLALMTAKLFFPTGSELGSLLLSLATLGVGLVARLAEVGVRDHPQECSQRDGLILAEPL